MRGPCRRRFSTPRIRAVGNRVKFTLAISAEPKWLEQLAPATAELLRDELADAHHLVAVIAVGNHVDVLEKAIEDREVIGRETADAARRLTFVFAALTFEAGLAMRER